ncbi:MAG: BMP-2-inducible protein kinase [Marteilia pararefringens]
MVITTANPSSSPNPHHQQQHRRSKASLEEGKKLRLGERKLWVKALLGVGAFAEVYKVEDSEGNVFALKKFMKRKQFVVHSAQVEVDVLSRLSHPNIVALHDYYFVKGSFMKKAKTIYVLLDFCDDNLIDMMRYYLDRREKFPIQNVFQVLKDISCAISYLHFLTPHPIIHRDIKLDNVLIKDSKYIVCDFGSCIESPVILTADNWNKITSEITLFTTPDYRCPEMLQLFTYKRIDTKADIWTLGCMAFMLIYYRPPFQGNLNNIITGELYLPDVNHPAELLYIICSSLKINPEHRPDIYQISHLIAKILDIDDYVENRHNSESIEFPDNLNVNMFASGSKNKHRRAMSNLPSVPVELLNEKLSNRNNNVSLCLKHYERPDIGLEPKEELKHNETPNFKNSEIEANTERKTVEPDGFRVPSTKKESVNESVEELTLTTMLKKSRINSAKKAFVSHKKSGSFIKIPDTFGKKDIDK